MYVTYHNYQTLHVQFVKKVFLINTKNSVVTIIINGFTTNIMTYGDIQKVCLLKLLKFCPPPLFGLVHFQAF